MAIVILHKSNILFTQDLRTRIVADRALDDSVSLSSPSPAPTSASTISSSASTPSPAPGSLHHQHLPHHPQQQRGGLEALEAELFDLQKVQLNRKHKNNTTTHNTTTQKRTQFTTSNTITQRTTQLHNKQHN